MFPPLSVNREAGTLKVGGFDDDYYSLKEDSALTLAFVLLLSVASVFMSPTTKAEYYPSLSEDGRYQYNVSNLKGKLKINAFSGYDAYISYAQFVYNKKQKSGKYKKIKNDQVSSNLSIIPGTYKVKVTTKYKNTKNSKVMYRSTFLQDSDFTNLK